MTKEKVLISLADNKVAVVDLEYSNIAEKQRKFLSLRRYYESMTYNDVGIRHINFRSNPQLCSYIFETSNYLFIYFSNFNHIHLKSHSLEITFTWITFT